jgi:hypothetical protein
MFTGHYHANDITSRDFQTSTLYDIETGSTVTAPCPYRTVDFNLDSNSLAIETSYVTSIASHPSDFASYAQIYLRSGMTGIVGYQLSEAPYNLTEPVLSQVTNLLVSAFVAHYAGDETPDLVTRAIYLAMMQSTDAVTRSLGQALYALWTDLPPADGNTTIHIER